MSNRTVRRVACGAAAYTFLLIVFGGIVRISGSGLGCGEEWPSCNGSWWPGWNLTVWIEWTHRLLAAGAVLPFAAVVTVAFLNRKDPVIRRLLTPAVWTAALLLVQAVLGAIAVKLGTNPVVTAVHFINALALLGLLIAIAIGSTTKDATKLRFTAKTTAWIAVSVAVATIAWGALTANLSAGLVCGGFPLCNGQLLPMGTRPELTALIHTHWTHRVLAYSLVLLVGFAATRTLRRREASARVRGAAAVALIAVLTQLAIGAFLVQMHLPQLLRVFHVAVGVFTFAALIAWALLDVQAKASQPAVQAGSLEVLGLSEAT